MKYTKRGFAAATFATAFLFITSTASALPSIDLIWDSNGTDTIGTPAISNGDSIIANIVLRGSGSASQSVIGVFITVAFDASELEATSAFEIPNVNLPGMGNNLSPISPGTNIDNVAGKVSGFDWANASAAGLSGLGQSRTLGSVTFKVLNANGDSSVTDVVGEIAPGGVDGITYAPGVDGDAAFGGASVTGPAIVPEPTTAFLVLAGLAGLGYAGRRNLS